MANIQIKIPIYISQILTTYNLNTCKAIGNWHHSNLLTAYWMKLPSDLLTLVLHGALCL